MGKIRVDELAKKLGLNSTAMLDKLEEAGIKVENDQASLDAEVAQKFEQTPVKIEEQRLDTGVIRRRRKTVPVKDVAPEPVKTDAATEPVAEEVDAKTSKTVEPTAPVKDDEPVAASEPEQAAVDAADADEDKPEVAAPVEDSEQTTEKKAETTESEPVAEPVNKKAKTPVDATPAPPAVEEEKPAVAAEKHNPHQAKILGRVELPAAAKRPSRGGQKPQRPAAGKPAAGKPASGGPAAGRPAPGRPAPGRPAENMGPPGINAPPADKDQPRGKKRKKGKERVDLNNNEQQPRRRNKREVFEPDRMSRKGRRPAKAVKKTEITVSKAIKRIIRISDVITVGELAKRMGIKANDLIRELMNQGEMVTINHPLDFDTASLLATEFQYEVENVAFDEDTLLAHIDKTEEDDDAGEATTRPPVVTIMGHVDHGKTSLLDAVRTTSITEGEAGGITQHIGAYEVDVDGKKVAFLDTPGHEAFTAMRSRGAQVTDIVILVVAADDGVMPQTKEAINHAKAAEVPIIVAVNKIDKPGANPDRVKQELSEFNLVPEDWGGETIFVEVSAKNHTNIDQLLEMILLQAEVLDLKAVADKRAKGTVVEARLDKGRGPVITVLVQEGTLKIGDPVVTGTYFGRVRSMRDDKGGTVETAGPSTPVEVTGLSGVPGAGDSFHSVDDEKTAKDVAQHRQIKIRESEMASHSKISLEQLYARIQGGDVKELKIVIKADVQGSVEAVKDSLNKLSTDNCRLIVLHTAVGGITESDITLASASDAIVLGFNVRPEIKAASLAESEGVDIRLYNIIYDAVDDIRNAMEGLLEPTFKESPLGRVEVRDTFHVSKVGTIAGCYVVDGKIIRNAKARLVRDNVVIWEGELSSLKRFKDDVKEVQSGYECGIGLVNYNDIKVGDVVEAYEMQEVKTTL
jgi:translation initiation factor IF-2